MGGVTRTIRKAAKTVTKPLQQVAKTAAKVASPIIKPVAEAVGGEMQRPDTFAGAPADVIRAAEQQAAQTIKEATGLGPSPKAAVGAGGASTAATQTSRRRRGSGRVTGARGVMGSAPVERKSLLGG
jgi:hypothetical protein